MEKTDRLLLSGNEAIALAASRLGVALGTGYPGTPSTEILENFSRLGGRAHRPRMAGQALRRARSELTRTSARGEHAPHGGEIEHERDPRLVEQRQQRIRQ